MSEPLRHSRCGCIHEMANGLALVVCGTHTQAVEGRRGMRYRTASGELSFFATATPDPASQPPPEESLCGEEEELAAGSFGDPADDAGTFPDQLRSWALHVRGVGRSRQRAYAEALQLAQMQFSAWQQAFPLAYAQAVEAEGRHTPLNARDMAILDMYSAGFTGFLAETHRIAETGGGV